MPENQESQVELTFRLQDIFEDMDVSPAHINVAMLNEFIEQVTRFIRGSRQIDLKQVKAKVEKGSLAIVASGSPELLEDASDDYATVAKSEDISDIDPVRRNIVMRWQRLAAENESRKYTLHSSQLESLVEITGESHFMVRKEIWAEVEKYVYGKVYDLGGKTKANVHVQLENGTSLKISSDSKLLATDKVNRLYQDQLLRIKAKENIETKELASEELISFEDYNPHYDEGILDELIAKGRKAWAGVNATLWVEDLRDGAVE